MRVMMQPRPQPCNGHIQSLPNDPNWSPRTQSILMPRVVRGEPIACAAPTW
jgi:hypothetical protein